MKVLIRIIVLATKHRWRLVGLYAAMIGGTSASLLLPKLFGNAIDQIDAILNGGTYVETAIIGIALGILVASTAQGLLGYAQTYFTESLGEATIYDIRNTYYQKVQNLSFAFHDKQHTGNLMSRAINDVEAMRVFVNQGLSTTPHMIVLFVTVNILLIRLDWKLGLIAVGFLPIAGALSVYVRFNLRKVWIRFMEHMGNLSTVLQENLSGVKVVRAFGIEGYEKGKYQRWNSKVKDDVILATKWELAYNGLLRLSFFGVMAGTLLYGGHQVVGGSLTPGELGQFFFYLQILMMPMWNIGGVITSTARAVPAGNRLFEIIDLPSPVQEAPNAIDLTRSKGHIRFEDVSFEYTSSRPVVKNIDIDATPGKLIALVGPPGAGKSTIVNLVPRFYDITGGRITIDGHDIRDLTLKSLRRNIGLVQQDVFAFTTTIAENIAYGKENATREEIVAAAKVAQLHDFIETLEDGYDTELSERGSNLSGGQRQRLSIARAVLVDPPILILDDSTASVDAHTEEQIRLAMEHVMAGRTTIVIANRLSTVHKADEILVMNGGEVAERGTHSELIERGGLYREIYDLQLRPQEQVLREFDVPTPVTALMEAS